MEGRGVIDEGHRILRPKKSPILVAVRGSSEGMHQAALQCRPKDRYSSMVITDDVPLVQIYHTVLGYKRSFFFEKQNFIFTSSEIQFDMRDLDLNHEIC